MKRIGYEKIRKDKKRHKKILCHSCGDIGEYRVYFTDTIGIVVIVLCGKCLHKEYNQLNLQRRFEVPLIDK